MPYGTAGFYGLLPEGRMKDNLRGMVPQHRLAFQPSFGVVYRLSSLTPKTTPRCFTYIRTANSMAYSALRSSPLRQPDLQWRPRLVNP